MKEVGGKGSRRRKKGNKKASTKVNKEEAGVQGQSKGSWG